MRVTHPAAPSWWEAWRLHLSGWSHQSDILTDRLKSLFPPYLSFPTQPRRAVASCLHPPLVTVLSLSHFWFSRFLLSCVSFFLSSLETLLSCSVLSSLCGFLLNYPSNWFLLGASQTVLLTTGLLIYWVGIGLILTFFYSHVIHSLQLFQELSLPLLLTTNFIRPSFRALVSWCLN